MIVIKALIENFHIDKIQDLDIIKTTVSSYSEICKSSQLIYIIDGELNITFNGNTYGMMSGDVAVFGIDDFYCIKQKKEASYLNISFECEEASLLQFTDKVAECSEFEKQLALEICALKSQINNNITYNKICSLTELIILYCGAKESKPVILKKKDADIFNKATAILTDNLQNQLSVEELAKALKISLSHLKRVFAEYAAIGVHEYFNYLKIKLAKQKLCEGMSVTDTAEFLGFANQAYFSTAFKRITGISPKEFSLEKIGSTPNKIKNARKQTNSREMPSYLL